jgi:glycosyltransferase involved in cell wall biosynthesis
MPINVVKTSPANQDRLAEIEKVLQTKHNDPELVRTYHDRAVSTGQIGRARKTYDALQSRFPNDQQIRSLNIALCLKQQDYPAAMKEIETLMSVGTPEDDLIDAALTVRAKLGPMTIAKSQRTNPTISLCMIVKDEIANIGACLKNAKTLADEIIVVDTGSTDRTADVATVFGARTFAYSWNDDFAAARNYSLDQAEGDWILILDADELVASKDHTSLQQQIAAHVNKPAALSITTRNYTHMANAFQWQANDGSYPDHETGSGWIPSHKVRLFPRMEHIRFQYPIHEKVDPSIREIGLPIVDCPIPVHHYGDLNESKKQQKANTYFKLGYAKLNQLGNDLAAIRELAVQAGQLEHWVEAIELWRRLLEMRPNWAEAYVNIAGAYWQMAQYDKALSMAQRAMELEPALKEARYNVAVSLLLLERATEAAEILRDLKIDHEDSLTARFMLAAAYGCAGDVQRSVKEFHALQKIQNGRVISMAIDELLNRLQMSGLIEYAHGVKMAANGFQTAATLSVD